MRALATIFVLGAAGLAVYWFMLRPVLRQWVKFKPLYDALDGAEATGWFKFTMAFKGLKRLLWSWFLIIAPLILAALQIFGSIDMTLVLPDKYDWMAPLITPLILSLAGYITLAINRVSTTPMESPVPVDVAVVEVSTVTGKPDVAIVVSGPKVVAEAPTMKTADAADAPATEPVKVAEVMRAVADGETVVIKAKEEA